MNGAFNPTVKVGNASITIVVSTADIRVPISTLNRIQFLFSAIGSPLASDHSRAKNLLLESYPCNIAWLVKAGISYISMLYFYFSHNNVESFLKYINITFVVIIAISGTPGTGKTSITELLKNNFKIVHLNNLAKEKGCLKGYDRKRKVRIVDYKCLDDKIDDVSDIVIESHYAHLMHFDVLIILRTKPDILRKRLIDKGFSIQKINENLEAEALGVISEESMDFLDRAFEIDTSFITAQVAADLALKIIAERPDEYRIGKIDWSEEILKWY